MKVFGKGVIHYKGQFIPFVNGEIETENKEMVELLIEKGYKVEGYEPQEKDLSDMNTNELQSYLKVKGVEFNTKAKKGELLVLAEGLEDQKEEAE